MKRLQTVVTALVATAALAACTTTASHGSRVELYSSIEQLAADSVLSVVVTVDEQEFLEEQGPGSPATLNRVTVLENVETSGLQASPINPAVGDPLTIRQIGTASMPGPAPLLETGRTYLLFLVSTGLDGAPIDEFYVTGGVAGIYVAPYTASRGDDVSDVEFEHMPSEDGDRLPETVDPPSLEG